MPNLAADVYGHMTEGQARRHISGGRGAISAPVAIGRVRNDHAALPIHAIALGCGHCNCHDSDGLMTGQRRECGPNGPCGCR